MNDHAVTGGLCCCKAGRPKESSSTKDGHHRRAILVPALDDLQQILAKAAWKLFHSHMVDDQQIALAPFGGGLAAAEAVGNVLAIGRSMCRGIECNA
jgi:hypothetical protein